MLVFFIYDLEYTCVNVGISSIWPKEYTYHCYIGCVSLYILYVMLYRVGHADICRMLALCPQSVSRVRETHRSDPDVLERHQDRGVVPHFRPGGVLPRRRGRSSVSAETVITVNNYISLKLTVRKQYIHYTLSITKQYIHYTLSITMQYIHYTLSITKQYIHYTLSITIQYIHYTLSITIQYIHYTLSITIHVIDK